MKTEAIYHHSSVYPGEYELPPWREKELADEFKKAHGVYKKPHVYLHDMPGCYKVEMAAPGLSREDFIIYAAGCSLSIAAMGKKNTPTDEELYFHDLHSECIKRHIKLPKNIDSEFVSADYKDGVLCLYFFKTACPGKNEKTRIIVY